MNNGTPKDQYKAIQATELFCPVCKMSVPVRERLLLVLPGGNLYDYSCPRCGHSLGKRDEPVAGNFSKMNNVAPPPGMLKRGR